MPRSKTLRDSLDRPFGFVFVLPRCYAESMALDARARRRWFGAILLLLAVGMLVIGEFFLEGRMGELAFLVYWLVCFGLTVLAMLVALADLKIVQGRVRQEKKELLQSTLNDIQRDARKRSRRNSKGHPSG